MSKVKNMKLIDFQGEDLYKVVCHIRIALLRLKFPPNRTPNYIVKILMKLLCKSSVGEFNQL